MNLTGYTYDADHHCSDCTEKYIKLYHKIDGREPNADDMDDFFTGAWEVLDSEDNPIRPMFDTEETDYPVHCSDCGEYLDTAWTDIGLHYVVDSIRDYLVTGDGNPKVLDIWAAELSNAVPSQDIETTLEIYEDRRKYELAGS